MKKLNQHILSAHKEAGAKWLSELPSLVQKLAHQWQLSDLTEYENLSWNYVASASQSGQSVVLKISFDLSSLQREVHALNTVSPGSCVKVIDFNAELKAVLLEAAMPGSDLMTYKPTEGFEALEICCDIAQKIQINQRPTQFPFDNIDTLFENLNKEWNIPTSLMGTARKLKRDLVPSQNDSYIIHGDLHRGNILSNGSSWLAIDPKGFRGHLYNEVWPFIHDPETELPWVAKRLNLNERTLLKWCFLHSILATTWCLEDRIDPKTTLGLAQKLFQLINSG